MLTDQQKLDREQSLGSSDAPVVAGVSEYKTPLELFYQLHGELPRYTDEETQQQRIGSRLEGPIAELAAEDLGVKIRRCATRRHSKHLFMVANLDYEIVNNAKGPGVLEIKNRSAMRPFDQLPDDITLQVAHQLAVTNRDWGIVAVLFGFGNLRTYEVSRDKELEEYLIELEARFMVRVQHGEPPTAQWNTETVGILRKLYPADSGKTIQLEDKYIESAEGFLRMKSELAADEAIKASFEGNLKDAMKDATMATMEGYHVTWKSTKASQKFDLEQFKTECPDLYQKYLKTVPGFRRFLVKSTTKEIAT